MSDKKLQPAVIALGYFDSVHRGHREVISRARALADLLKVRLAVFTFGGNLKASLCGGEEKYVYSPKERAGILYSLGADEIIFAPVDEEFLSTDRREFLENLDVKYDVKGYVCGDDYRFGRAGEGDVAYLSDYALEKGKKLIVCETVMTGGEKISTTMIKKLLAEGDIRRANDCLGSPFFITGEVAEGRKVGRKLGFPTVNLAIDKDKQALKDGVYAGHVNIGGIKYRAIINYGTRPTFGLSDKTAEAHILGFEGDLYGQELTLYFQGYMREVKRFAKEEDLAAQLSADRADAASGKYD